MEPGDALLLLLDETQTAELKRLRERNQILERQIGGLQLLMEEMKDAARLRVEETKILNDPNLKRRN